MPYEDKAKRIEYGRQYYQKHKKERLEYQRKYVAEHREQTRQTKRLYKRTHWEQTLLSHRKRFNRIRGNLKQTVFNHYDNKCACCGETEYYFLSLDHVNNNGAEHRRQLGTGKSVYKWLIDNNFPDGFQILCFNCNLAKAFFGLCPHQGTPPNKGDQHT